jgi:hypothetical protein
MRLFNLSLAHADIPAVWKRANIIPIPKPGKPVSASTSYRPISLLSPCIKVLERLLVPYVTEDLPCAPTQHGYKPLHSNTTALLPIVNRIVTGLNEDKPASRSVLVSLDISKAFDAIDHVLLLKKVSNSSLNSNIVRWLSAYLRGRTAVCLFQGAVLLVLRCHQGVPQESMLSLQRFSHFISDFPAPAEVNESYADDFYLLETSPKLDAMGTNITEHLKEVSAWSERNKLGIAPSKSHVTLFTPWNREVNFHPHVLINDTPIPLNKYPKALGINFSPLFAPAAHFDSLITKLSFLEQLLKALKGQDYGDKETFCLTYQALIKPVISFGAPVYFPSVEPDSVHVKRL